MCRTRVRRVGAVFRAVEEGTVSRRNVFRLPRHPASVALARRRVHDHLIAWGRTEGDGSLDDTVLLISELATNSVRYGPGSEGEFEVAVTVLADGACFIEVTDASGQSPRIRGTGTWYEEGGRGLRLVETLTEAWGVWHRGCGGTTVWALVPVTPTPLPGGTPAP